MIKTYKKVLLAILCFIIFAQSIIAMILKNMESYIAIPIAILAAIGLVIVLTIPIEH